MQYLYCSYVLAINEYRGLLLRCKIAQNTPLLGAKREITGMLACCRRNSGISAMREDAIPGGNLV
jgi:hypothetical protein